MRELIKQIYAGFGRTEFLCLFLLATGMVFDWSVVVPLKERAGLLDSQLERIRSRTFRAPRQYPVAVQLATFHRFFQRRETADEWLVKLYAIANSTGIQLRIADYELADSRYGIERYRISLPVIGQYTGIRRFLQRAMAQVPVLSLDQASFSRPKTNDSRVQADLTLTLYLAVR